MSAKVTIWAWRQAKSFGPKEGPLLLTFLALADMARDHGKVWASHNYLATKACQSPRTIRGNIEELEKRGLLRTEPTPGRPDVIWLSLTAVTIFEAFETDEPGALEKGPRRPRQEMPTSENEGAAPAADGLGAGRRTTPAGGADKPRNLTQEDNRGEAIASPARTRPLKFAPDAWQPSESHRVKAEQLGLSAEQVQTELEKFREFEFAVPKTDWDRTFHRWLREAADRMQRTGHGRGVSPQPNGTDRGAAQHGARIDAMLAGAREALDEVQRRPGGVAKRWRFGD